MIEVKKLSRTFGKGESAFTALKSVSISLKEGESVAVVGKSGSGKSTLMHLLTGLDRPTSGKVIDGSNDIFAVDTDTWRGKNVGIVFQQFFLQSNISVLQNVILPLKISGISRKEREQLAEEALKQVGLGDKLHSSAGDLSGGQKQRVAIARALVMQPRILVADEPTGNLDSENGAVVADLLFELNARLKTTLVIVTHDEELASRCQRVIYLKDGQVVKTSEAKRRVKA